MLSVPGRFVYLFKWWRTGPVSSHLRKYVNYAKIQIPPGRNEIRVWVISSHVHRDW
jgi:hypothetical protein